jgi:hypothetical protein
MAGTSPAMTQAGDKGVERYCARLRLDGFSDLSVMAGLVPQP